MEALTQLANQEPVLSHGWVEELGAVVIDETTRLVLSSPDPELGWRMEKAADELLPIAA